MKKVLLLIILILMPILVLAEDSFLIETSITLTGKKLEKDEFKFVLKNQDGEVIQTKKNDVDGKVVFDEIAYDSLELNQTDNYFLYTIEEVDEKKSGYTYDKYKAYVKVHIKKESNDTYTSVVNYYKDKDLKEELKNTIPKYTQKPYHATAEELEGTSFAKYDITTKTLTFFRDDPANVHLDYSDYGFTEEDGHQIMYIKDAETTYYKWRYYTFGGSKIIPDFCEHIIVKDAFKPQNGEDMFSNFKELLDIDMAKMDTSNFTSMQYMFAYLPKLEKIDLTTFDFSNVTNMGDMFSNASSLSEIRIGSEADMSNVTSYNTMFRETPSLEIMDMSWFKVTGNDQVGLLHMFQNSGLKYLDLSHWNFKYDSNNQRFSSTFQELKNLEYLDISNLTTDICGSYTSNDFRFFSPYVRNVIISKEFNNMYSSMGLANGMDPYWYNVDENILTNEFDTGTNDWSTSTCNFLKGGRYIYIGDDSASFVSSYKEVPKEDKKTPSKDNKKSSSNLPGDIEKHIINPETNDVFALVVTALALSGIIYVVVLKKKKSKLFLVLLIGILSISLTGCNEKEESDDKITSFYYSYSGGIAGIINNYNIKLEDEKYIFEYDDNYDEKKTVSKEIDEKYIKKLVKIIDDNNVKSWNGFDKSEDGMTDGFGFTLKVEYESGEKIEAHGYGKFPDNFSKVTKKWEKLFSKFIDK